MTLTPRLDILGAALADSSRARMLCELMDGRAYTNKELASAAGVTPQTATAHLRRLEEAGLIRATRSGRCLYHSIAGPDVAEALETLSALAPSDHLYRVQQRKGARLKMLEARSCYDHLAGRLGVAIAQALLELGDLARDGAQYRVVPSERWAKLGVTLTGRAPLARPCLAGGHRQTQYLHDLVQSRHRQGKMRWQGQYRDVVIHDIAAHLIPCLKRNDPRDIAAPLQHRTAGGKAQMRRTPRTLTELFALAANDQIAAHTGQLP